MSLSSRCLTMDDVVEAITSQSDEEFFGPSDDEYEI